jgi:DNA-directed RNA polymerase subunit RPC12/RpoP
MVHQNDFLLCGGVNPHCDFSFDDRLTLSYICPNCDMKISYDSFVQTDRCPFCYCRLFLAGKEVIF